MKLADSIASHPKILRGGALVGRPHGGAEVLAMYVAALGHCRTFITDGFVSDDWIKSCALFSDGAALAKVLADPRVQLWHRVRGGYRIHDFHDWNDKASEIKQKRRAEVKRVAAYRARKGNGS